MARLHTSGFEENNLLATMWNSTFDTAPTIVTTPVHSGTYALQVAPVSAGSQLQRTLSTNLTSGTLFLRTYFQWNAFSSGTVADIMFDLSSAGVRGLSVRLIQASKFLRLRNSVTATEVNGTNALTADTWYRIEARHLLSDTAGEMEVRLFLGDSTTAIETLSITGEDTLPTDINLVRFGTGLTITATFYYDDIVINDGTGTVFNTWPGPGKIFLLEPSSDVSVSAAPTPSDGINWNKVDDLPGAPDDATTYVDFASATTDRYGMTDLGAEVPSDADIILLDVYGRTGSNGTTGTRTITFAVWDEAAVKTSGPTVSCSINGWRIINTAEHQVFDAGTRTKANIADFNVGGDKTGGGTNSRRLTAQWVNVEWIEAAAAEGWAHLLSQSRNRLVVDY